MQIDLSSMNFMEWLVWLALLTVILLGVGGLVKNGLFYTRSRFWRIVSFALPAFPISVGAVTLLVCHLIGYDNGNIDAFHPDSFMFGCFMIASPVFIGVGLLFSTLATGIRLVAITVNIVLAVLWFFVMTHIHM